MPRTLARCISTQQLPVRRIQQKQNYTVLGIESSCDDTACSIVNSTGVILGDSKVSHLELVARYGGVYPNEMAKAHEAAVEQQIWQALLRWDTGDSKIVLAPGQMPSDAQKRSIDDRIRGELDCIAVTAGPGIAPCLRAGVLGAKDFAAKYDKPVLLVNHLEAHMLTSRMVEQHIGADLQTNFPFLVLLVSGGHCMLLLARSYRDYEILGQTQDDSVGEAYDKVARLLGLDLNKVGGAELEKLAEEYRQHGKNLSSNVKITGAMRDATLNFSFSGMKSSVLRIVRAMEASMAKGSDHSATVPGPELDIIVKQRPNIQGLEAQLPRMVKAEIAYHFQEAVLEQLCRKTRRAIKFVRKADGEKLGEINSLVICGGVASNLALRKRFNSLCEELEMSVCYPPISLCTDNGSMIAWAGVEHLRQTGEKAELYHANDSRVDFRQTIQTAGSEADGANAKVTVD